MDSNVISPKYQMELIDKIDKMIWETYSSYQKVEYYIKKWYIETHEWNDYWQNFNIERKEENKINLSSTLHNMDGELLLKIAIDLGIETPDFIPSIPIFRNELKTNYPSANSIFDKAFKQIEEHPDVAIGLANSALEAIIKEILQDSRIKEKVNLNKTLYDLTSTILKEFSLFPNSDIPQEITTIGSSMLAINKSIEKLRSEKTSLHGKLKEDIILNDSLYAYFIINSVATIGIFMNSFYKKKFPKEEIIDNEQNLCTFDIENDEIPF